MWISKIFTEEEKKVAIDDIKNMKHNDRDLV